MTMTRLSSLLKSWAGAVKAALDVRDFLFFGGLSLLGYGLWLYAPWLGFAVYGFFLMVSGYIMGGPEKKGGR